MKKFKTYITFIVLTVLAVSCDKIRPDPITAIALNPVNEPSTKAPVTGTIFPDRTMNVCSYYYATGGGTSGNHFQNITFTKSGSVWVADKYWPLDGELDFFAWSAPSTGSHYSYANSSKVTNGVTISVSDNSSTQEDILFGYAPQTGYKSSVDINFKHAQALITFKAKSSVAYNSSTNVGITVTGITLNNAKYSGTCAMTRSGNNVSCTWSSLSSQTNKAVPGISGVNLGMSYSSQIGTGIMVPEQECTSATVTYTLHNGKSGGSNIDVTGLTTSVTLTSPDGSWLEGKNYCYQLDITQNGITLNPTVTDWFDYNDGNPIEEEVISSGSGPVYGFSEFAGYEISKGPMYSKNYGAELYINSQPFVWHTNNGFSSPTATSFSFIDLGKAFEKSDFTTSDGDIDMLLDPLEGWKIPSRSEWNKIITTDATVRVGSTVNDEPNKHYALIQLYKNQISYGTNTPNGLLLFPDGKTITGVALSGMDNNTQTTGVTKNQLNTYIEQGCFFLPANGYRSGNTNYQMGTDGYFFTRNESSSSTDKGTALHINANTINYTTSNKSTMYMQVYLIREI